MKSDLIKLPDLSLYIHFPWCVKKCPYCDFNSHKLDLNVKFDEYLDVLLIDLEKYKKIIKNRKIVSVFLGGGTPSLFPLDKLEKLFDTLFTEYNISKNIEITLEVNPGTIERASFLNYKKIGINRISLGVQSFQTSKLKKLGRIHDDKQVYQAITELKEAGFENFNIDLMHGLENQTVEDALFDLQTAIDLNPSHISWYQLTIEKNTLFYYEKPELPDEDILSNIESLGYSKLANAGFERYEVSAYAKDKKYSNHNVNYWKYGDYIGIGAGAYGKVTSNIKDKFVIYRYSNHKHPKIYLQSKNVIFNENIVTKEEIPYEFMINAMRLNNGFNIKNYTDNTNLDYLSIEKNVKLGIEKGLLKLKDQRITTTELGKRFLNDIINLF